MKKNRLISFILLFAISFSIFHEYAIAIDKDVYAECELTTLSHNDILNSFETNHNDKNDKCNGLCFYHAPYILPFYITFKTTKRPSLSPKSNPSIYPIHIDKDFLKPPIA